MKVLRSALVLALTALPASLAGQAANPLADAVRENSKEQLGNILQAAQAFPADKYGFKPTPAQMTWGEVVLHVANSAAYLCSSVSGVERPGWARIAATAPKDTLVARLQAAVDYCNTALATFTDAKAGEQVQFFGNRQVTRAFAAVILVEDLADHYSQAAIYLRLNGLLPPTARQGGGDN